MISTTSTRHVSRARMLVADLWVTSATERPRRRRPKPFHAPRGPFKQKKPKGFPVFFWCVEKWVRFRLLWCFCFFVFFKVWEVLQSRNKQDVISTGWTFFLDKKHEICIDRCWNSIGFKEVFFSKQRFPVPLNRLALVKLWSFHHPSDQMNPP